MAIPLAVYGMSGHVMEDKFFAFHWYLAKVSLSLSICTYLAVSIERFIAIVYPLQARWLRSRKTSICFMIFDWVAVAAGCLPYYFLYVDCEIGDRKSKTIREFSDG